MTQEELEKKTGVSLRMIVYYEFQDGHPTADILLKLSYALGVTIDELLGRSKKVRIRLNLEIKDY